MCWINYLKETNGLKIFLTGWQAASRSSKRVHLREHLMTRRKKEFSERYARTSRTTSKNPSCTDLKICSASCVAFWFCTCKNIRTSTTANSLTKFEQAHFLMLMTMKGAT